MMYLCEEDDLSGTRSFGSSAGMADFREKKKQEAESFARRVMNNGH